MRRANESQVTFACERKSRRRLGSLALQDKRMYLGSPIPIPIPISISSRHGSLSIPLGRYANATATELRNKLARDLCRRSIRVVVYVRATLRPISHAFVQNPAAESIAEVLPYFRKTAPDTGSQFRQADRQTDGPLAWGKQRNGCRGAT